MNSEIIEISNDAFKIVISFEIAGNTISIEKQSIDFKIDNKNIILKSTFEDELISTTKYLTIVVENYKNYRDAAIDMQKIDQSLKLTALDNHIGLINEYSSHDEHLLKPMPSTSTISLDDISKNCFLNKSLAMFNLFTFGYTNKSYNCTSSFSG